MYVSINYKARGVYWIARVEYSRVVYSKGGVLYSKGIIVE